MRRMLRRAFVLLLGTVALNACAGGYAPGGYGGPPVPLGAAPPGAAGPTSQRVAILLPLSGARADLGQSMLHAAQLALEGAPLDAKDTGGTPDGAAAAARAAIA